MTISQILAKELAQKIEYIDNVIGLIDEGNKLVLFVNWWQKNFGFLYFSQMKVWNTNSYKM